MLFVISIAITIYFFSLSLSNYFIFLSFGLKSKGKKSSKNRPLVTLQLNILCPKRRSIEHFEKKMSFLNNPNFFPHFFALL